MRNVVGVAVLGLLIVSSNSYHVLSLAQPNSPPKLTLKLKVSQKPDAARFLQVMQSAQRQKLAARPIGEIIQAIAQNFVGAAYKAGLLDKSSQETLFVSLDKFDCVLFVETVLAIARSVATQDYSYDTFTHHLQEQRYLNGEINGYCSRLHYFSAWIADNQKRGTVQNITQKLGGMQLNKKLNFMSHHRQSYPRMANETNYQCILQMEASLDGLAMNYIPRHQIRQLYTLLQPGDIVAIATDIQGLDVTHTGLVYRYPNGNIGIIHASPSGSVRISADLQAYVQNIDHSIGIMVARASDRR